MTATSPKVATASPTHCPTPAHGATEHQDREVEHQMRAPGAGRGTGQLRGDVGQRLGSADPAPHQEA